MSTARNIIKNRIKAGNTVLGVGCYSAAIESTSDDKIIKVGNTTDDPWLYYEAHDCYGEFNASRLYDVLAGVRTCKDNSIQLGCNDECDDGQCNCSWESLSVDLHLDNIMYRRDGTVVINDPLCDTDMDEVDDLSNWADEMEIVE